MNSETIQKIIPKLNTVEGASELLRELGYGEFLEEPYDVPERYWVKTKRDTGELVPLAKSGMTIATPGKSARLYSYFYELNDDSCDRFGRIKITAFRPIAQKHASDTGVPLLFFAPPKGEDSDEVVLATFTKLGKIGGEDRISLRWVRFHRDNANARTPLDVLEKLPFDKARHIREIILSAFALEPLTDKFYREYKDIFDNLKTGLVAQLAKAKDKDQPEERAHEFASLLMNRLMFLWFVQKKGWLDGKQNYLLKLFDDYGEKNFYADRVQHVFNMLNEADNDSHRKRIERDSGFDPGALPFLNGGLFDDLDAIEQTSRDKAKLEIDNSFFKDIFHNLFQKYNFTVEESTPQNIEIAVDPEMLGHVFEQMVTGRHESGSYYTPKQVVNFMCKEAIKGYLRTQTDETETAISALVDGDSRDGIKDIQLVNNTLNKIVTCDPACGSGAYLLGMLHNIIEIQKTLMNIGETDTGTLHRWKQRIISQSIYGVDIDPFAVSIAKLRLWLSLVVDETRDPLSSNKPDVALPNLEFKIEVGDSLTAPDPSDREYSGDMFQIELLKLADELGELKDEFLRTHDSKGKEALRGRIHSAENRLRGCLQAERTLPPNAFDWRVEFAEVFRRDGFDVVIANPPYVRQEQIDKKLKDILGEVYPQFPKRSDLFVYFYARGVQLLKKGGMHIFVCSNSWLDVGYGAALQEFLLDNTHVHAIFDSAVERQFSSASINTIVSIIQKGKPTAKAETRFVLLKDEFETAIREYIAGADDGTYRMRTFTQKEMRDGGTDPETDKYAGDKWGGKYLRAPDIYWKILEKAGDKLVRLGDIAEIRRGFTTGANEFFYLEPTGEKAPKGLMHVKNGAGWEGFIEEEFLKPGVQNNAELETLISMEVKGVLFFNAENEISKKKSNYAFEYVEWGESQEYHLRSTCKGRSCWYVISGKPSRIAFNYNINEIGLFYFVDNSPVYFSDNFHTVDIEKEMEFVAISNSSLGWLVQNVNGRVSFGGGKMKLQTYELKNITLPTIALFKGKTSKKLIQALKEIAKRPFLGILREYGLVKKMSNIRAEDVSLDKVLPDRRELDRIVFEAIGLSEAEQLEVYRAVVELVKNRLVKAKSISGQSKKGKE